MNKKRNDSVISVILVGIISFVALAFYSLLIIKVSQTHELLSEFMIFVPVLFVTMLALVEKRIEIPGGIRIRVRWPVYMIKALSAMTRGGIFYLLRLDYPSDNRSFEKTKLGSEEKKQIATRAFGISVILGFVSSWTIMQNWYPYTGATAYLTIYLLFFSLLILLTYFKKHLSSLNK